MNNPPDIATAGFRQVVVDGHRYWADPATSRVYPHVAGADEGEGDNGDGDDGGGDGGRTFTQADLDRATGRARAEGRRTAANDVAEQLGCTIDEARQVLDAVRAADDAQQSAAQRAMRAAEEAEQRAVAREQAAADRERTADLRDRLRAAGVPADRLDRAVRALDVTADSTAEEIAAEVDEVAPMFTTTTTEDPPPGAPPNVGTTPARPPAGTTGGKTAQQRAKERFEAIQRPHSAA